MGKKELTPEQKKLDTDLWIVVIISLAVLGAYMASREGFITMVNDHNINILLRVLIGAVFQFSLAGLGIAIVGIIRRESFFSYGLKAKGAILSVCLCSLCVVPHLIFLFLSGRLDSYLPFQSVWTTKELLVSGFPSNIIGMAITSVAWGFFEGFNYVVICDKINRRYPSENKWLDWGAMVCTVLCIVIHGAVGVTLADIIEMLSMMIIIYGMLITKKFTGNAWGCVFVFVFLWNAF